MTASRRPLELWAGAECSMIRVRDRYADQVASTGHGARLLEDLDRLAALGARAVRFPVAWERTAPCGLASADWSFADRGLSRCRELGLRPIVGLVHHGSGPRSTSLLDEAGFVGGLGAFARAVAERYPWVADFTPVNEPGTTARFSALYGHWYPHDKSARAFVRALLAEVLATREAMRAAREVTPGARLVQTEDLGTVFSTPHLAYQATHENERRLLSLDLLAGRVDGAHPLRGYLEGEGAPRDVLDGLVSSPCPPDVVGVNYYLTSDRFLDERVGSYPPASRGGNGRDAYADVEAVRVRGEGIFGHGALLGLLWERYRLPIAITEVHLGCTPEEQIRWLTEAWDAAEEARRSGADVRAVTVWSAFGACDWDSLCTVERGSYEPGPFDARLGIVRPTALARVARELAERGRTSHPLAYAPGWWRRDGRLLYPAHGASPPSAPPSPPGGVAGRRAPSPRPVLVIGARGTLGRALCRALEARGIAHVALTRAELDAADGGAVDAALALHCPWAVVNAAGDVRVDDAEHDGARCIRENLSVATTLAAACARLGVRFATFSSDLVFDGEKGAPYVESDSKGPLNVYGLSKARAEEAVLERCPDALLVRTAAFFGPFDPHDFVATSLSTLRAGRALYAADDLVVSPTYVPDLAHGALTLLVDGGEGVFHLANVGAVTWAELALRAAEMTRTPSERIVARSHRELGWRARRPRQCPLGSERAGLMPSLEDALERLAWHCGSEAVDQAG